MLATGSAGTFPYRPGPADPEVLLRQMGDTFWARAAVREVEEESGVTVEVTGLAGVYTDPGHVMFYPDTGEARQQFAVCFLASPIAGRPRPDGDETREAAWVPTGQISHLPIHPSIRMRIIHALTEPAKPHFD